ncbi:glucosamine-6-phosphate deaminase [Alteribacillus sp. HJP-4]|uniref:glucosamine-6-phosphate deaminase n=1 Tax=Alteribacillus sp. HJP-4 TaxID=2775394 RepID=UPI0035CCE42D
MEIIQVKNYKEMSLRAAGLFAYYIKSNPQAVLGLATGGTPVGMYRQLAALKNQFDASRVTTFNLDEYEGLPPHHPQSYYAYMKRYVFDPLGLSRAQTNLPRGDAHDLEAECRRYEQLIKDYGYIDLQLLGIGENGHIGFNEPGTSFTSRTHLVTLKSSTREANARYFKQPDLVPDRAITAGIATIMSSSWIVLLASGPKKSKALEKLLTGEIHESFPASILREHPRVTIIADNSALSTASSGHR